MKITIILSWLVSALAWIQVANAEQIKIAVTTSFHNSGLAERLVPEVENDLDLKVRLLVVGTGQAMKLGMRGDVDAILVHSKTAEMDFISRGFAPHRREVMYNDFVVIGPASDPADVKNAKSAVEALQAIQKSGSVFVSRGDGSGTHKKEISLWRMAELEPEEFPMNWYYSAGSGMGATLNMASAIPAYTLADRASWLNFQNKRDQNLLFSGDPALFNQYAFLPISRTIHPHVNVRAAYRVEKWLTSEKGQMMIGQYRLNGEQLFVPNAKAKENK